MRDKDQWICWREEHRDGDPTKIPVNPANGNNASTTDADTWTSFDEALQTHQNNTNFQTDGIGFVFTDDDLLVGVDLDDCRDPTTAEVDERTMEIMERLDSYTEISPSGEGFHIIVHGFLPDGRNRHDKIEMYETSRFFTVTGHQYPGPEDTVKTRKQELQAVHEKYVAKDTEDQPSAQPSGEVSLEDEQLLEKARNAANGNKFEALWSGDTSGYESHSEADQALCNLLAFWTGGDPARMDDLFRQSGLNREKWRNRADYRERTIQNAIDSCTDFYEPSERTDPTDVLTTEATAPDQTTDIAGLTKDIDWSGLRDRFLDDDLSIKTARHEAATALNNTFHFKALRDTEELWLFTDPIYEPDADQVVRQLLTTHIGDVIGTRDQKEIINKLKDVNFEERPAPHENAHLIPVENGVYNLETGELQESNPQKEFLVNQIPVTYDPDADCPHIKQFLSDLVHEQDIIALQELIGYCLYSDYKYTKCWMLLGSGENGKSTFLNLLEEFLGTDNVANPSLHELLNNRFARASLYGKLANINADLSSKELEGTGIFKELTGEDTIRAEKKHQDGFEFKNTAKLIYAANELPATTDMTDAFFRRWHIIEFPYKFTDDPNDDHKDKDPSIKEKILQDEELSGLLNFALEGLHRILENDGFTSTAHMDEIKQEWMQRTNPIMAFCEHYVERDEGVVVPKKQFAEVIRSFCEDHGSPFPRDSEVGQKLPAVVGYVSTSRPTLAGERTNCWSGIRVSGTYAEEVDQYRADGPGYQQVKFDDEDDSSTGSQGGGGSEKTGSSRESGDDPGDSSQESSRSDRDTEKNGVSSRESGQQKCQGSQGKSKNNAYASAHTREAEEKTPYSVDSLDANTTTVASQQVRETQGKVDSLKKAIQLNDEPMTVDELAVATDLDDDEAARIVQQDDSFQESARAGHWTLL